MKKRTLHSIYKGLTVLLAILALAFIEAAIVGTLAPIIAVGLVPATLYACGHTYCLSLRVQRSPARARKLPGAAKATMSKHPSLYEKRAA